MGRRLFGRSLGIEEVDGYLGYYGEFKSRLTRLGFPSLWPIALN